MESYERNVSIKTTEEFQSINMLDVEAGNMNYTNPYREVVKISNMRDFYYFVDLVIELSERDDEYIALCGRVNHDFAEILFDETGLNFTSYRFLIEGETIRHIYQKHLVQEKSRPIELAALLKFGVLISNYFSIKFYSNTDRIEIFSKVGDYVFKVILAVDFRHANLYLVTIFRPEEENIPFANWS